MMINGVLGPISAADMGVTLMHEHVTCSNWSMRMSFGDKWLDRDILVKIAVGQFKKAREQYGIKTVVDGTAVNIGRDIKLIKEVAEKSGVNFIASSGFYFGEEPCLQGKPAEQLIELMLYECKYGIEGTNILPGILKSAVDVIGFTPMIENLLYVTAEVQKKTNLPLFCHSDVRGHTGLGVQERFKKYGVDLSRVIIGHSGDTGDLEFLEALLKNGSYIGLDRFVMCAYDDSLQMRVDTIYELIKRGWIDRLIISHDTSSYLDWGLNSWARTRKLYESGEYLNEEADFTYIHRKAIPLLLKKGLKMSDIDVLLIDNPRRFFEGR